MTVNPQLDVLRDKIDAAANLADCLTIGARLDAVSPADWPGILADLWRLQSTISSATETAAAQARNAGVSWAFIGEALHMTKQGAQQRYSR